MHSCSLIRGVQARLTQPAGVYGEGAQRNFQFGDGLFDFRVPVQEAEPVAQSLQQVLRTYDLLHGLRELASSSSRSTCRLGSSICVPPRLRASSAATALKNQPPSAVLIASSIR